MKTIIIGVIGGVATVEQRPHDVCVIIRDYDNTEDHNGKPQKYSEDVHCDRHTKTRENAELTTESNPITLRS